MSIASFTVPPRSIEQFSVWSFSHMAHHRDIIRRIRETTGTNLFEYALDPFNPADLGVWAEQHQAMHDDMNQALYGVDGADLTGIDWQDQDNLSAWLARNYAEHARVATTLGI